MTHKTIELFGKTLKVFEDGKVLVKRYNKDEFYEKKYGNCRGYSQLQLVHKGKTKYYFIHRLVAYVFLGLDLENPKSQVDHIDRNPLNNFVSNLRIVTNQQNMFNKNAKGYYWHRGKWKAVIQVNEKKIHLGYYDNEEDATKAYQDAKLILHII
tara:strand:- start:27 stop:488 length:462 start_codon:yes stop_codon:yes gene_type:complete